MKYNIDYNLDSNQDLNLRLGICLFDLGFGPERPSCIPKKMFAQKSQLLGYSNLCTTLATEQKWIQLIFIFLTKIIN